MAGTRNISKEIQQEAFGQSVVKGRPSALPLAAAVRYVAGPHRLQLNEGAHGDIRFLLSRHREFRFFPDIVSQLAINPNPTPLD